MASPEEVASPAQPTSTERGLPPPGQRLDRRTRLLDLFARRRGGLLLTKDIADFFGVTPDQKQSYAALIQWLRRLCDDGTLRRPSKGCYRLAEETDYGTLVRQLASSPLFLHGLQFHAPEESVRGGSSSPTMAPIEVLPPTRTGRAAGNKVEWRLPLGGKRTMTITRSAQGWNAAFGVTDRPFLPGEFEMAGRCLAFLTGVDEGRWVLVNWGVNKDLLGAELKGISEAQLTLHAVTKTILRVYEHDGRGTRTEVHSNLHVGFRTAVEILNGSGLRAEARFGRIEAVLRDLASVTADNTRRLDRQEGGRS